MSEKEISFIGRHTQRASRETVASERPSADDAESEHYLGITKRGEEMVRETVEQEFVPIVDSLDPDGVLFLGGASEEERTKSTGEAQGDVLQSLYAENETVRVIPRKEVDTLRETAKREHGKVLDSIQRLIESHADTKVVISYPLYLKGWSVRPGFIDSKTGKPTPFQEALDDLSGGDTKEIMRLWLESKGRITHRGRVVEGPSPDEVAKEMLADIVRLRKFAKKFVGDRQLAVSFTGHGGLTDMLLVRLANAGDMTSEGFETTGGEMIRQSEVGVIEIEKGGAAKVKYRGREFDIPEEVREELQ